MIEYNVSFEICTKYMTLSELNSLIGLSCSEDSHEKGKIRGRNRVWEETYWKLFSNQSESASIEEHIANILEQIKQSDKISPSARCLFPIDSSFYLSIGVFYDMNSKDDLFEISPPVMEDINSYQFDIEICLYPSSEEK